MTTGIYIGHMSSGMYNIILTRNMESEDPEAVGLEIVLSIYGDVYQSKFSDMQMNALSCIKENMHRNISSWYSGLEIFRRDHNDAVLLLMEGDIIQIVVTLNRINTGLGQISDSGSFGWQNITSQNTQDDENSAIAEMSEIKSAPKRRRLNEFEFNESDDADDESSPEPKAKIFKNNIAEIPELSEFTIEFDELRRRYPYIDVELPAESPALEKLREYETWSDDDAYLI